MTAADELVEATQSITQPQGNDVHEPQFRPVQMNVKERGAFIQKVKADRLAFEAAELLSRGEVEMAATLANECTSLAGAEKSALWVRHYATTRFKVAAGGVDIFLSSMPAA